MKTVKKQRNKTYKAELSSTLLYSIAALISLGIGHLDIEPHLIWPALGAAIAIFLYHGIRQLPIIFLITLIGFLCSPAYLSQAHGPISILLSPILFSINICLSALFGAWITKNLFKKTNNLSNLKNIFIFFLASIPLISLLGGLLNIPLAFLLFSPNLAVMVIAQLTISLAIGIAIFTILTLDILSHAEQGLQGKIKHLLLSNLPSLIILIITIASLKSVNDFQHNAIQSKTNSALHLLSNETSYYEKHIRAIFNSINAFYQSSNYVDRSEFNQFITTSLIKTSDIALTNIKWIPIITNKEKSHYVKEAKQSGIPQFIIKEYANGQFKPRGEHPFYLPIYYIESFSKDKTLLGYDLRSNPTLYKAIMTHHDDASILIFHTPPPLNSDKKAYSLSAYLPIIKYTRESITTKKKIFLGFISGELNLTDLINQYLSNEKIKNAFNFSISIQSEGQQEPLFLYTKQDTDTRTLPSYKAEDHIRLFNITLTLKTWPNSTYIKKALFIYGDYIQFLIMLFVLISMSLIYFFSNQRKMSLQMIYEKTEEIRKAQLEAEAANQHKSSFLANMSHEIRTPINGIMAANQLINDDPLSKKQKEFTQIIDNSCHHLLEIIDDILDFSKIEANKIDIHPIKFNLKTFFSDIGNMIKVRLQKNKVELIIHIDPSIPEHLIGDPVRIRQIIINFANNALKFTEDGFIFIHTQCLSLSERHIDVRFTVKDSGIGIPKEKQGILFTPFTQADNSTTRKYGGTGLGLSICKRLVDLMEGSIGLSSALGRGSAFWADLTLETIPESTPTRTRYKQIKHAIAIVEPLDIYESIYPSIFEDTSCTFDFFQKPELLIKYMENTQIKYDTFLIACDHAKDKDTIERLYSMIKTYDSQAQVLFLGHCKPLDNTCSEALFLEKPFTQEQLFAYLNPNVLHMQEKTTHNCNEMEQSILKIKEENLRILLVEDNQVNQMVAKATLEKLGCSLIDIANHGKEALHQLSQHSYDILFMDCHMPVMNGFETTKLIREEEETFKKRYHQHIVAMTADTLPEDKQKCLDIGMDSYLSKPIQRDRLIQVLLNYINQLKDNID